MSLPRMKIRRVVSNFIFHAANGESERLLLLKRSDKVRNYQGLWCTVSGSIDADESPRACAVREIGEEIGVKEQDLLLIHQATEMVVEAQDRNIAWHVTPFMWRVAHDSVEIDWEHTEYAWIAPEELSSYDLVPDLEKTYEHIKREQQQ